MTTIVRPVGQLLKDWRLRRRQSQLDLALEAEISTRHLSFIETGRALPSRDMVLRLAAQLDVPLRERNQLLHAAGYAALYPQHALDDPALAAALRTIRLILKGHEPYPALAVDRHWRLIEANDALRLLLEGVADHLLKPPVNVLRLSLHPEGLASRIMNLGQWRGHILERLRQQILSSADAELIALMQELATLAQSDQPAVDHEPAGIAVPLRLASREGPLNFISTTTIFGTPVDVTLSEIAIESFFPADDATVTTLNRIADRK